MSSSDGSEFKTDITANPSDFEAGMRKAAQSAVTASAQIDAQFKKIGDGFANATKLLTGFTAVMAGGGALKKFISDANEWNGSAGKMAKQLGITTEQASVLNVALKHIGVDSDVYTGAAEKMSKQIQGNAQAFEVLGVKTRDASGAYRPVTELMGEVNQKLLDIKNPIEQNIAGQQVYGKGWGEIRGILKLTTGVMSEAEVRAKQLGLIVGPEGAKMSKQYGEQMRDLGLIGKSLEVQFGNALLPVFTKTGQFMAKEGPQMGQAFAKVLEWVSQVAQNVWLTLKRLGEGIGAFAAMGAALLSGDFAGAKAIYAANLADGEKYAASMKGIWEQAMPAAGNARSAHGGGVNWDNIKEDQGPKYHFGKDGGGAAAAEPSRMGAWEAALAEKKAAIEREGLAEGQMRELSKAEELKYWADLKGMAGLNATEKVALARKTAEAELSGIKQTFEQRVAVLQTESAMFKSNTDERLRIEHEIQANYQAGTKEYEASAKRIVEIERQASDQRKQVAGIEAQTRRDHKLAEVALAEQSVAELRQLGLVDQEQVLQAQRQFEGQRNNIAREALQARLQDALADPDRNPVAVAQIQAQLEALEREHQARLGQIRSQESLATAANFTSTIGSIQQGWASLLQKLGTGTLTIGGFIKGVFQTVASAVVNTLATMAAQWMAKQLAMMVFGKAIRGSEAVAEAAKAGAGGVASMAAAPFPLNLGAPAFGAAMSAAALAFAPAASAAGGYDIPGSINPIVQAHAREMILPAKHADVIRSMADGSGGAGPSSGATIHLHTQGGDWVHKSDLAGALRELGHNFAFVGR